jgi:hypothetical protein
VRDFLSGDYSPAYPTVALIVIAIILSRIPRIKLV